MQRKLPFPPNDIVTTETTHDFPSNNVRTTCISIEQENKTNKSHLIYIAQINPSRKKSLPHSWKCISGRSVDNYLSKYGTF